MIIEMLNAKNNLREEVKVGFSWTTFFFGALVPLLRGDWKWFLILIVAGLCTYGFAGIIFAFFYNKIYIRELIRKGYTPTSELGKETLKSQGITM
ncbi:HrgC protein [Bacillus cereus group sp. BfR-BA-02730]|uniref:HrgC protein n=1 Tax=Bacillus cereus group sp. BfR-BA-02730 TaxID=3094893 RepID=UPI0029C24D17|nr:HrgC protein [Bacillus cereus group sp. BfR-BA-02730]MDX5808642.1 HrgC protein [Bacillus cereus group sp. BfR-BA-02730]